MEKKRWSLIFIGLCLALVFSMSPVEAQMHHMCVAFQFCDQDGDGLFRVHSRCEHCFEGEDPGDPDPNDHDCDSAGPTGFNCPDPEPDPPAFEEVVICHFKNTLKHCTDPTGSPTVFFGGGERTVTSQRQLDQHLEHGDCTEGNFTADGDGGLDCVGHCVATPGAAALFANLDCAP